VGLVTASLADVAAVTPRSRLLTIDLGGQTFAFKAGQAVMFGPHGSSERRPYSIANGPGYTAATGLLQLLLAADAGMDLSWAVPRALVDLEGPLGDFTFDAPPPRTELLFVAGGVGIAPLRSMLQEALTHSPVPPVTLLYSARKSDDFAFIQELESHARAGQLALHQTVTRDEGAVWQGRRGRVGRGEFEAVLREPQATLCFVCGPSAFVADTVETLKGLGVPDAMVRVERWGR
jgi:ferredoxin-NADP reductase